MLSAGIYNLNAKQEYTWYPNTKNTIRFGWQSMYYDFKPSNFEIQQKEDTINFEVAHQYALENSVFLSNEQIFNTFLSANYGLRVSSFSNIGPYTVKEFDEQDQVVDSTVYEKNEFYNTYYCFEPRVNITLLLNETNSIKASYNCTNQFLHMLSNSTSGTPTDMWSPSTQLVKPQKAHQFSAGFFTNLFDGRYEVSVESYYKILQNQVEFEDGAEVFFNPNIESELVFGHGKAYGLELYIQKKTGKFTGWISYTLSRSLRQFDDIDNGKWFSARQDRLHDLAIVASYQILPNLFFSATWVYYTGDAVTFPAGKYYIDGVMVNLYTERNGDRMPDYHRLDLGLTWVINDTKKFHSELNISTYNAYNRKNAYSISFKENSETGRTEAERLSLFGIVPSISWNFRF
jgi:hypothetical protein